MENVTYDRKERQYLVYDGNGEVVRAFPCGKEGRRAAHRFAVVALNPELAVLAQKVAATYPELEGRAWRAAQIVLDAGVQPNGVETLVVVASGSGDESYTVSLQEDTLFCDCLDYPPMIRSGQRLCKHCLAYLFMQRLNGHRHA